MGNEQMKIKTLVKSMRILELFIDEPVLGVTDIARRMMLNKSNVSDILSTFVAMGYVDRDEQTGKYILGVNLLKYAYPIVKRIDLHRIVYPHMLLLAEQLREIVYLAILNNDEALYLQNALPQMDSSNCVVRSVLGEKAPLYCTGIGKAMLSRVPEAEWAAHMPKKFVRFADNTLMDDESVYADLRAARLRGYAVDNMEHEYGVRCVGIPLVDCRGKVVAGLSVSGPMQRLTVERCEEIACVLQRQSSLITACL